MLKHAAFLFALAQLAERVGAVAEEQRRAVEASELAAREEARRRQAAHAADLAALNREVEAYRQVGPPSLKAKQL